MNFEECGLLYKEKQIGRA